jgi:hypothetical protein
MRTRNPKRTRARLPGAPGVTTSLLIGLIVGGLAVGLASASGRTLPAVGDIIVFKPGEASPDDRDLRIAVYRPGQYGCVLSLGTLQRTGGSLIVEARLAHPALAFRLHWAGARTSTDGGDCGGSADMIVQPEDLESLVREADGYGIGSWRIPLQSAWAVLSGPGGRWSSSALSHPGSHFASAFIGP